MEEMFHFSCSLTKSDELLISVIVFTELEVIVSECLNVNEKKIISWYELIKHSHKFIQKDAYC